MGKIEIKHHNQMEEITLIQGDIHVVCLNYGARLYKIFTPDRHGNMANILLSHDDIRDILNDNACFGATVGPVAGRIANGLWKQCALEQNLFPHTIHSGSQGWQYQYWQTNLIENDSAVGVQFYYQDQNKSKLPGNISCYVTYLLNKDGTLVVRYEGISDAETLFNPTNHAYFNLSGNGQETIEQHQLWINSRHYLQVDKDKIPTGEYVDVATTALDFQKPTLLADALAKLPQGIDDTFVLNHSGNRPALKLIHNKSGRSLSVYTNRAAIVIFSTTNMNENYLVNGREMISQLGLAIEPQEHPDAAHHNHFPSITLMPEQRKILQTTYCFNQDEII